MTGPERATTGQAPTEQTPKTAAPWKADQKAHQKARRPTRGLVLVGVLVALLLAGVVSFYASGSPDGLERVAEDQGFGHAATDSAAGGSPLADYGTRGVGNERLSTALAGVAGVGLVLGSGTGVAYLARRLSSSRPN